MLKFLLFCFFIFIGVYFVISTLIGKIFLLGLFAFVIAFFYYSAKIKDFYGISMLVGQIGSGKSSIICYYIRKYLNDGYTVYADFETNIPGCRLIDLHDLANCIPEPESVIFCDESSLQFFSRDFSTFKKYTQFFAMCRHCRCKVVMASQSFDIDLYIRNRVNSMYLIKRVGCISYMRKIKKLQTVLDCQNLSNGQDVRNSGLVDGYQYAGFFEKNGFKMFWLPSLWKWHDSFYMEKKPFLSYTVPCTEEASKPSLGTYLFNGILRFRTGHHAIPSDKKQFKQSLFFAAKRHDPSVDDQPPKAEPCSDPIDVFLNSPDPGIFYDDSVPRIRRN